MNKKITFKALSEYDFEIFLKPYPASSNIPDWFKKSPPYFLSDKNPSGSKMVIDGKASNAGFKKCTPMLDAITSGYIIPLWSDVLITQTEHGPEISWRTGRDIFENHSPDARDVKPVTGYSNNVVKYLNTWIPHTPKGYSVLVTAPFGHRDLPFHAVPGIIDSDKSILDLSAPMWIKEGFEGVVEKGTPLLQITPFKRENWESEFGFYGTNEYAAIREKSFNSTLISHYVKNAWSKKSYK